MRVVGRNKLDAFAKKHGDARPWIAGWVAEVEEAQWKTPGEMKKLYPKASILSDGKGVIFDVKGNDYRMHVRIDFRQGVVLVVKLGTHAEYDRWAL